MRTKSNKYNIGPRGGPHKITAQIFSCIPIFVASALFKYFVFMSWKHFQLKDQMN